MLILYIIGNNRRNSTKRFKEKKPKHAMPQKLFNKMLPMTNERNYLSIEIIR